MRAINPLTWSDQATASLSTEYQVHQLVSLWPDSHNYLYVWSSKRTNITASGDYTPVSSDIHVYDRESLKELAVFRHVRTGFDSTMRKSDDENSTEVGRGLVFIYDKKIAYVAYDSPESKGAHASIWCIDETGLVPESTRTISSRDINGYDVDIESPMTDTLGGFYFTAVSGDLNAPLSSKDISSYVYHYSSEGKLEHSPSINVTSNAELVMTQEGRYKGSIFMYNILGAQWMSGYEKKMEVFLWNGGNTNGVRWQDDDGTYINQVNVLLYREGLEIEKPFTTGTGFFYSMETSNPSTQDEKDTLCYWDGRYNSRSRLVWSSDYELEVEDPPLDGKDGFYFVNADLISTDARTIISTMTLMHGTPRGSTVVCDLGSFVAPPSTFIPDPKEPNSTPLENVQNEFALVEIPEQNQLFAGAGVVGGKFRLTVFDWTQKAALESGDNVIVAYDDKDMGGNANIGGMVQFTEARRVGGGSSGGCEMGFGLWAIGIIGAVIFSRKRGI